MLLTTESIASQKQGLKKLVYVAKEDPKKVKEYHDGLNSEIQKARLCCAEKMRP